MEKIINRNPILYYLIKWTRSYYERQIDTPPYLKIEEYFPEYKLLEENWEAIRDEALNVFNNYDLPQFFELDKGQAFISNNDGRKWNLYVLKLYGKWLESNIDRCPVTYKVLSQMPNVTTANLSFLAPGKHIPKHVGPYKGILRYQLALKVPKGKGCRLYVDDQEYHWEEGKSVLFDDTYPHEVINETEETRIALLLDVKRPHFNGSLKYFDKLMYASIKAAIALSGGARKAKVS
jgi:aspartate beta-hydroxylase